MQAELFDLLSARKPEALSIPEIVRHMKKCTQRQIVGLLHGSQKFYRTKGNLWTCHDADPVNSQTEVDHFLNKQKPISLGKRQRAQITRRFK